MKIFQPTISGSFTVSGSVFLKGLTSVAQSNVILVNTTTGQLYYTASSAIGGGGGGGTVDTSSLVTTASFNAYTGSNTSQFAGTASYVTTAATATNALSASNFVITSTLRLDQTLTDFATVASTIVGSNNLFTQITGSYRSAFGKYTLYNGVNARSGEFWTTWNGTTTTYTDTSTTDIGNTADIVFSSTIVTSQLQINAVAATSAWNIKMLVTYI
jgi:hypothetical protein